MRNLSSRKLSKSPAPKKLVKQTPSFRTERSKLSNKQMIERLIESDEKISFLDKFNSQKQRNQYGNALTLDKVQEELSMMNLKVLNTLKKHKPARPACLPMIPRRKKLSKSTAASPMLKTPMGSQQV